MKYRLLLILAAGAWWYFLGRGKVEPSGEGKAPAAKPEEAMVQCARCGVYLPASEAVRDAETYYCCPAHRPSASGGQG